MLIVSGPYASTSTKRGGRFPKSDRIGRVVAPITPAILDLRNAIQPYEIRSREDLRHVKTKS